MYVGEICAQGDNIMVGYYKNQNATRQAIVDDWLHTGDMGYVDKDDFFYITGRKKNVIISGGVNIYPEEIEEVLISNDNVVDAYVYGVEDLLLGEVVYAKIVIKEPMRIEDLKEYCLCLLGASKTARGFIVCSQIEKTPTGKILRNCTQ